MNSAQEIRRNLSIIEDEIAAACSRSGRSRDEVRLMAVSKLHPLAAMQEAAALGVTLFGENKVQEFAGKQAELGPAAPSLEVHLIGHLQSNKAARAAELFAAVDTLDSVKLAERLQAAAAKLDRRLPVLLEIKLSDEDAKSGIAPDAPELGQLLERIPEWPHLELRGLMTVPPYLRDAEAVRPWFQQLRALRDTLAREHPSLELRELSMGMSHDYAVAIEEGATQVRVGTALFGARDYGK